jgi:hypothetical protein
MRLIKSKSDDTKDNNMPAGYAAAIKLPGHKNSLKKGGLRARAKIKNRN